MANPAKPNGNGNGSAWLVRQMRANPFQTVLIVAILASLGLDISSLAGSGGSRLQERVKAIELKQATALSREQLDALYVSRAEHEAVVESLRDTVCDLKVGLRDANRKLDNLLTRSGP